MSGHSKWATTHRQKEVADAKKGAVFTRLGKAISIAAREGGNPESNFKLRLAIDKARESNMPKDNIDRAIARGTGELKGVLIEQVSYEGFGPGKTAIVIEAVTDNRNRTSSDIKHILSEHGGSLGTPNSVMWLFERLGVIKIPKITDELELELIDAGATDISKQENGIIIYTKPHDLQKIKELIEKKGIEPEFSELELIAKDEQKITDEKIKQNLEKLFEALEENEDVSNYYSNAGIY